MQIAELKYCVSIKRFRNLRRYDVVMPNFDVRLCPCFGAGCCSICLPTSSSSLDASLVAMMLGTYRSANLVEFADHSGTLLILPGCSSLADISLAMLWWVTISQVVRHRWCHQDILWCLFACVSVVALNVTRLTFMGLSHSLYDAIHSTAGNIVANVITLGLTVLICMLGVRREVFSRA